MPPPMDFEIRPMRRDEMPLAIELAAREGWNPGLHDAECFHAADPGGFLMAERDGERVGCIAAVSYGEHFGFIGLFIVVPAWRGRGVGRALWDAGMARLTGRVVGLDGVPAQQGYYARKGFVLAWQNARYAGHARPADAPDAAHAPRIPHEDQVPRAPRQPQQPQAPQTPRQSQIVPIASIPFDALRADDRRVFPAPRDAFLQRWIQMPDAIGLAGLEGDRLAGWGLVRPCREGHKIGPLVADSPATARALLAALCAAVPPGQVVFLDIPLANADAVALVGALGWARVFETARMYAGPAPQCEMGRVYGITSFELG